MTSNVEQSKRMKPAIAQPDDSKKPNLLDSTRDYLTDIRSEMRRVTWPSRKQVESTTLVVILSVFAFAAYFYGIDKIIQLTVVNGYNQLVK